MENTNKLDIDAISETIARTVADFLDIDGIIEQMIEEYKEAACNGDDIPLASKIRNVIKFGMYLLLAQSLLAYHDLNDIHVGHCLYAYDQ